MKRKEIKFGIINNVLYEWYIRCYQAGIYPDGAMLCVCLYSSACWFLSAARDLWHTWEFRINDLLLRVFIGASAKFIHLYFWIYHVSPPKTKTPADSSWRENEWMLALEEMKYIDIGYMLAAQYKNRQWRKDTKDKEATLI